VKFDTHRPNFDQQATVENQSLFMHMFHNEATHILSQYGVINEKFRALVSAALFHVHSPVVPKQR
jgi:hypothetical protein